MKDLHSLKRILKLGHRWHQRERIEGAHHHLSSHDYCALVDQALSHAELQGHYRHLIVTAAAKTVDDLSEQERLNHCAELQRPKAAISSPENDVASSQPDRGFDGEDDYPSRLRNAIHSQGSDLLTNQEIRDLLLEHWIQEYQSFGLEEWEALFQGE